MTHSTGPMRPVGSLLTRAVCRVFRFPTILPDRRDGWIARADG
ncbi:hypothetical protein [Tropicimonas isoalkanivorans]|nr:hypothetical protein [Tropicimonas isoalkanivorans]